MLLFAALAAAHVPHAVLAGAVAGPEGEPWWALHNAGESSVLYRSDDAGHLWRAVPAAPTIDDTRRLARLDDGTLVLLSAHRLWWSTDGASWSVAELESSAVAVATAGDTLVVQVALGAWLGPPEALTFVPSDVVAVGGGAALVTVESSGDLRVGDEVRDLPVPAEEVQSLRAVPSGRADPDVYLGTTTGETWHDDGTWVGCGALDVDPAHPEIAALVDAPGGDLYALAADGRLFASTDACATWVAVSTPFRVDFGGSGGAADVDEAIGSLVVTETDVLMAGWDGLVRGPAWAQERVIPPDYIRGAAVSPEGAIYLASLTGVLRSFDGGATWDAPQRGAEDGNVQRVAADPLRADCVWAIINHRLYRSTDRGTDWVEIETGMSTVADVWILDVPWISGDGTLAWYDGRGWVVVAEDVRHAWVDGAAVCAADDTLSRCTTDRGAAWEERPDGPLVSAAGAVGMREDALVYEGAEVLIAGDDAFRNLTRTAGGVWYASTRSAEVYRSADGVVWEPLAPDLPSAPNFLLPVGEDVLLATYDGAFLVRGDSAGRFGRYQAVLGSSGFDDCEGCSTLDAPCAWGDHLTAVDGAVAVDVRGTRVWVSAVEGDASLWVDGVWMAGTSADVADGLHEVRVEGAFRFGAIEALGPGATLPVAADRPVDDCGQVELPETTGCGGCRGVLVLPLLLGGRRRIPRT